MKKFILPAFFFLALNINAEAVVLFTAITENPKKAEASLILRDRARQLRLEERRNELLQKHALKKTKVAKKTVPDENSQLPQTSLATDLPANTDRGDRVPEAKVSGSH